MAELSNDNEKLTEGFNALSFERKLVELAEELRLRRNLEAESEKTLKSVIDEKYQVELNWEEQQRRYMREKEDLEQQISLLKRKLEDKVCVSDDDKAKQQVMNRTYSHEIKMLKEELRTSMSEKLNLQKKIQELEGKLNLHNNFQDSIMIQISDVRKMIKSNLKESQELANVQKTVMENVTSAKSLFRKFDLCNQHLQQSMTIVGKKSEALKKELILSRSEITILKNSSPVERKKCDNDLEIEQLQKKVLNLENLLVSSRKENEKTLINFLESNKLLCKFMDKYSDTQEREKLLTRKLQELQEKLEKTEKELQETQDIMEKKDLLVTLKENERIQNQCSSGTQTEFYFKECCSCSKAPLNTSETAVFTSLVPEKVHNDFIDEIRNGLRNLQQNAVVMQSEMYIKNGVQNFSMDHLSVSSSDKKITVSEVLKRKLEVIKSGDKIELISMKRRFTDNSMYPTADINIGENKGTETDMQTCLTHSTQSCIDLESCFSKYEKSFNIMVDEEYLISNKESTSKVEGKSENDN